MEDKNGRHACVRRSAAGFDELKPATIAHGCGLSIDAAVDPEFSTKDADRGVQTPCRTGLWILHFLGHRRQQ